MYSWLGPKVSVITTPLRLCSLGLKAIFQVNSFGTLLASNPATQPNLLNIQSSPSVLLLVLVPFATKVKVPLRLALVLDKTSLNVKVPTVSPFLIVAVPISTLLLL